ncbi:MAG: rhomboid family intramembrane serine protease [Candidatus Eisenbacteria bacterium]|nr:rhomboid family intramembrane serine protease [Candidatus Eisenbacteria bacterium]MCC7142091.1 rhomboid family intramembrane serine protease [Candidatus Eisenbacteria bacterium]
MFPLGDDNSDRRSTPVVNYALIALNVAVFALFQRFGSAEQFTNAYATVPAEILTGTDVAREVLIQNPADGQVLGQIALYPTPIPPFMTLFTAMFMHGDFMHIIGNMLYLWIFGDNLEDRMGKVRYLIFYLLTGILAGLAHVGVTAATSGNPFIPCVGASGAISGVLGGYLLLFPGRRVTVIMLRMLTQVPAVVAIGLWFVFQVISGVGSGGVGGGVAYGAHIGGFIAGLVLVKLFAAGGDQRPRNMYANWP